MRGALIAALVLAGVACERHTALAPDGGDAGGRDAATSDGPGVEAATPPAFDPGFAGMRRLSDAEYARTIQDVLGLSGLDAMLTGSLPNPDVLGGGVDFFDNTSGSSTFTPDRFEAYFSNAVTLTASAFASDALRARIVTCAPASPTDDACATTIVRSFGLRAWRRPLSDAEVADLVALIRADLATGDAFADAVQQAIVAMLSSETFLHRIELDPSPTDFSVHPVTAYELATRLSYFLWSTLPDDQLMTLAASGELLKPEVLAAQASRMLDDARADALVRNFFGQWLGFRALEGNPLLRSSPGWSPALQASMATEARRFVTELVQDDASIGQLMTADVNFVDAQLAAFYDLPAVPTGVERVTFTGDARKGYLGLGAFLALESEGGESSRFPRGLAITRRYLCELVPSHPPDNIPQPPDPNAFQTPQQQWLTESANPSCDSCHKLFEPLGLGLENFDAIGAYRTTYANGATIDATGALSDGTPFDGLLDLADRLGAAPSFAACARREAVEYATGRILGDADAASGATLDARWAAEGRTMRGLIASIVVDELFRYRRGEGRP